MIGPQSEAHVELLEIEGDQEGERAGLGFVERRDTIALFGDHVFRHNVGSQRRHEDSGIVRS